MPQLRGSVILGVENRGRDLWPLAQLVNAGLLDSYDLVVKVHTKRSQWREAHRPLAGTGGSWRSDLLAALLGDVERTCDAILDAFERTPDLGIVTADGSVLGPAFWGRNEPVTASLLKRLGPGAWSLRPSRFAAGSMYWARGIDPAAAGRPATQPRPTSRMSAGRSTAPPPMRWSGSSGILAAEAGLRIVERSQLPDAIAPST